MTRLDFINKYDGISDINNITKAGKYHQGGSDPKSRKEKELSTPADEISSPKQLSQSDLTIENFSFEYQSLENMGLLLN